jgi:quercetin dioxygenase-like cupin family protein
VSDRTINRKGVLMTVGSVSGKRWIETIPRAHSSFSGRTFARIHIVGDEVSIPTVGEIWASQDHEVESHEHDRAELLYVLRGAIKVNDQRLDAGDVVFIPKNTKYRAGVASTTAAHVLRVELPGPASHPRMAEYDSKEWSGALDEAGFPDLTSGPG